MNQADLKKILSEHKLWLRTNGKRGKCANLEGLDLKESELYKVELKKARLSKVNLKSAYLVDANFEATDLEGANLQGANLAGTNLSSANLKYAELEMADFSDANLQNANLREADLDEAIFVNANLQGANLEEANLFSASMENANLIGANLKNAILEGANLEGASLDGANISGADFTNAVIRDTDKEELIQRNGKGSVTMKKIRFDSKILETAKSKFIDKIITAVNQEDIKDVVVDKFGIASINSINIKNGDIFIYNNKIAFRLEFEATTSLSCILDSEGNLLEDISQISVDSPADVKKNKWSEPKIKGDDSIIELSGTVESTK